MYIVQCTSNVSVLYVQYLENKQYSVNMEYGWFSGPYTTHIIAPCSDIPSIQPGLEYPQDGGGKNYLYPLQSYGQGYCTNTQYSLRIV